MLHLQTRKPPFDQPDLRRAVNLAIDRQEIVAKTLDGAGLPCAVLDPRTVGDFALPLDEVNRLPGCRQPKDADLAEARRLVEKHHPGGLDIEIAVRAVGENVDRAQLVAAQLRRIGIRGTIKSLESAAGFALYGKGEFTLIASQDTAMVTSDPSDLFGLLFRSDGGRNYGRWSDPKVDALIDQGLQATGRDRRRQIYHELQRALLTRDTPAVALAWVYGWYFRDRRVHGHVPAPTVYDNNTYMAVWLKP
jgi:peptide/nickel transport system substrate-binding protein